LDVYRTNGVGYSTKKYEAVVKKAGAKPIAIGECDILPTPEELAAQPRWTFFMCWAERVREKNAESAIRAVYESDRVVTLDEMPGWKQK
jgi:mannan endo-1,4-beta-mannosidase